MNIYFREEIINIVEEEIYGLLKDGPLNFDQLAQIVEGARVRQKQYVTILESRPYPTELKPLLIEVMNGFDLVNFWGVLGSRTQTLGALVTYLTAVNTFLQKVQPHLKAYPDLGLLCLRMTAECDEITALVLKNFHPIPEIHQLTRSARALRQALEMAAA